MKIKKGADLAMGLLMLLICASLYQQCTTIHPAMIYARGPLFFPKILIGCMALLSVVLLYQSVDFSGAQVGKSEKSAKAPFAWDTFFLRWSMVGLVLVYLVALPLGGYTPTTAVFLFATMCLLGPRTPRKLALYGGVSVAVAFGLAYIFGSLLKLFLP